MQREQRAFIGVDLSFGDTGKGTMIDYLAREHGAHTVVRFNGGAQAGHNVITEDGRHHTFSQFGSGTFVPGVRTFLSQFMIAHPLSMFAEEEHLRAIGVNDAFERTSIDARALLISPFQQSANRLRELARGNARHGSCGVGIGETVSDSFVLGVEALRAGDLRDRATLSRKLRRVRDYKREQLGDLFTRLQHEAEARRELDLFEDPSVLEYCVDAFFELASRVTIVDEEGARKIIQAPGVILFEAAQGVLLDEWRGFHPYTTWSTTTFDNALQLLQDAGFSGETTRIGILRAYATRHGAGPFVTEDGSIKGLYPEPHNVTTPWQQSFRIGHFDLVASRYALEACRGADVLAITHLDRVAPLSSWKVCEAYQHKEERITKLPLGPWQDLQHQEKLTQMLFACTPLYRECSPDVGGDAIEKTKSYIKLLEESLGVRVGYLSFGPTAKEKRTTL